MNNMNLLVSVNANSSALTQEVEDLTLNLLADLEAVGVRPRRPTGVAPAGAKALDFASISHLMIAFVQSGGLLVTIVNTVRDWLGRQNVRSVVLEVGENRIELKNASSDEQTHLIEAWLQAVQGKPIN